MAWPFKRKTRPTPDATVTRGAAGVSRLLDPSPTLDRHFKLLEQLQNSYTPTSEKAVEKSIEICNELIAISEETKNAWIQRYGLNRGPGKAPGLPSHPGYRQLAIIYEKREKFENAIAVAKKALKQGWSGDWEKRIARCESKIAKRDASKWTESG